VDDGALLGLCHAVADAVPRALATMTDRSPPGERPGQYALDLVADDAVLGMLEGSGLAVLSEESGYRDAAGDGVGDGPGQTGVGPTLVAVVDPVDGSTNAARGIPWYATSICIVDDRGPRVAVVDNLPHGLRYHAVRGGGAWRGEERLAPSACARLDRAVVGLSGYPRRHLGWAQFRSLGAAALDLCLVAEGVLDAFCVGGRSHLAPWDYMGALLVCTEAGALVGDLHGEDLVALRMDARRSVVAAATPVLYDELVAVATATRDEHS
jgi:myo-inositol-1(or 4)-monophosphatase